MLALEPGQPATTLRRRRPASCAAAAGPTPRPSP